MVSSLFASRVTSTDLESVVDLARANFLSNQPILEETCRRCNPTRQLAQVSFEPVNWSHYRDDKRLVDPFGRAVLILASDVIYDNDLTLDFLNCTYKLMTSGGEASKCALVSVEQRINVERSGAECSTCYDLFERSMIELDGYVDAKTATEFQTDLIDPHTFAQYFTENYQRNPYLKLWRIKSVRNNGSK
jgi:hypothetical protein